MCNLYQTDWGHCAVVLETLNFGRLEMLHVQHLWEEPYNDAFKNIWPLEMVVPMAVVKRGLFNLFRKVLLASLCQTLL